MQKVFKPLEEVAGVFAGNSARAIAYALLMKRLVQAAKQPGFSAESWSELADMVETDQFERVGNFKEAMTWRQYVEFLTRWATTSEWDGSFKRVTEVGELVFLELEERSQVGEFKSIVNSATIYEFSPGGKIKRLDVYLQMEPVSPDMLQAYG